ncbi:MAG: GTPase [Xenococcus sp. (in: cyanobacteria)]
MESKRTSRYNIVIAGKSGVGKTSLLNYLFDTKAGKTGVGKPITTTGFHPTHFMIGALPVTIFDSWGIEVNKAAEWKHVLDEELSKRGVDKSPEEWFHTIFYCVQVGGSRIEDFEVDLIKGFIDSEYKVIVLLTKADQGVKNDLSELERVLKEEIKTEISVIPVCSVDDERLDGTKIKSFGRRKVFDSVYVDFWNSISMRLPARCESVIFEYIDKSLKNIEDIAVSKRNNYCSTNEINKIIESSFSMLVKALSGKNGVVVKKVTYEIKRTMKLYGLFSKAIATEVYDKDISFDFSVAKDIRKLNNYNWLDLVVRILDIDNLSISFNYWWSNIKDVYALITLDDSAWNKEVRRKIKGSGYELKRKLKVVKPRVKQIIEDIKNPKN